MPTKSHSTVEKALQILLALSDENSEIGTSDLGRKLGIHKATVSRILLKLAEYNFVYKSKETGKYWLGPAVHQLAMTIAESNFKQIKRTARPHIRELCDAINETISLEIWLGNSTVPTFSIHSSHHLMVIPPPGEPLPLHAAAGAKAILSFTHTERINVLLGNTLTQFTQNTITDKKLLIEQLVQFNKQGYAVDNEELHKGICGIAAPIFDQLRQPIAAITILIPAARFSKDLIPVIAAKLKKKAALVTTELAMSRA